jgi:hypothetical protein
MSSNVDAACLVSSNVDAACLMTLFWFQTA